MLFVQLPRPDADTGHIASNRSGQPMTWQRFSPPGPSKIATVTPHLVELVGERRHLAEVADPHLTTAAAQAAGRLEGTGADAGAALRAQEGIRVTRPQTRAARCTTAGARRWILRRLDRHRHCIGAGHVGSAGVRATRVHVHPVRAIGGPLGARAATGSRSASSRATGAPPAPPPGSARTARRRAAATSTPARPCPSGRRYRRRSIRVRSDHTRSRQPGTERQKAPRKLSWPRRHARAVPLSRIRPYTAPRALLPDASLSEIQEPRRHPPKICRAQGDPDGSQAPPRRTIYTSPGSRRTQ